MVSVLHPLAVLNIRTGFSTQALGSLQKRYPPATGCQLTGDDHAGQTSTDNNSGRICHCDCSFIRVKSVKNTCNK